MYYFKGQRLTDEEADRLIKAANYPMYKFRREVEKAEESGILTQKEAKSIISRFTKLKEEGEEFQVNQEVIDRFMNDILDM